MPNADEPFNTLADPTPKAPPPLTPSLEETFTQPEVPSQTPSSSTFPEIPGYRIHGTLGHGGMGIVFTAWDERLRRDVALKLLLDTHADQTSQSQRFVEEAQITGQ